MKKLNYLTLLFAALLVSGSAWAELHDIQTADDQASVVLPGGIKYGTLSEAFKGVTEDSVERTITVLKDVAFNGGLEVRAKQNVLLELAGKVIAYDAKEASGSVVITNNGTLSIQDSSEEGTGIISTFAYDPSHPETGLPGYANNVITNKGILVLKSGTLECKSSLEGATYTVDNQAMHASRDVQFTMYGGTLTTNLSYAVRMYLHNVYDCKCNILGGSVNGIFVQDDEEDETFKGTLAIENATVGPKNILVGYNEFSENIDFSLKNVNFTGQLLYYIDPNAGNNKISLSNVIGGQFYMNYPKKILTDGVFAFIDMVDYGYCNISQVNVTKKESYGWIFTPTTWPTWVNAKLPQEGLLHSFYQFIADGYGLIPVEGKPMTYRVGKTNESNGTDVFWHRNPTWSDEIPVETDAVEIKGKNVFIENGSLAVAASIIINKGDTLFVGDSATLNIGDAGLRFDSTTSCLVISASAVVTVGANGIISESTNNIIIKSNEKGSGVLLMDPDVTINTRPYATVEMFTRAGHRNNKWWWQHFGIPTSSAPTVSNNRSADTWVQKWVNSSWEQISSWSDMNTPFLGYNLTNSYANNDGVTYSFKGNLVGNNDAQLNFVQKGYNLMGNSYTAPLDLKTMFEKLSEDIGDDVEITAWVYEAQQGSYWWANKGEIESEDAGTYTIAPMQGFILRLMNGSSAQGEVDYVESVWENPNKIGVPLKTPARQGESTISKARIVVSANGYSDLVKFYQKEDYTNDFDNGYDASKYMTNEHFNLFVESDKENLATVASDNMDGLYLSLKADANVAYTLSFENVNNFNYSILDTQTGVETPIVEGMTYDFVVSPNATTSNRFQIVATRNMPTAIEDVVVPVAKKGVYTALGQYVGKTSDFGSLPTGLYIVDGQRIVK